MVKIDRPLAMFNTKKYGFFRGCRLCYRYQELLLKFLFIQCLNLPFYFQSSKLLRNWNQQSIVLFIFRIENLRPVQKIVSHPKFILFGRIMEKRIYMLQIDWIVIVRNCYKSEKFGSILNFREFHKHFGNFKFDKIGWILMI